MKPLKKIKFLGFLIIVVLVLTHYFSFAINKSESLPYRYFLVLKSFRTPCVGDYIIFKAPRFPVQVDLLKKVYAGPGDIIVKRGLDFWINDQQKITMRSHDSQGHLMEPGPEGVLNKGYFFTATEHPFSYDSRYKNVGWVHEKDIIGIAYPIF